MATIGTTAKDKVLNIELPEKFSTELLHTFEAESKTWLLSESQFYIFDFKKCSDLIPSDYRVLVSFCSAVGKAQKKVASINVSHNLAKQFKKDGVFDVLNVYSGGPATVVPAPAAPTFNVNVVNPIILSVIKVLDLRANIKGKPGKPYLPDGTKNTPIPASIRGTIHLSGDKLRGEIRFYFNESVFMKIYEGVCGTMPGTMPKNMQEALGQFLALVYEEAKADLQKVSSNIRPVFHAVVAGEQVKVSAERAFIVPFVTESGDFQIEVSTIAA